MGPFKLRSVLERPLRPSHQKAYVEWIEWAKRVEARQRRIAQAVDMNAEGQQLKGIDSRDGRSCPRP